MSVSRYRRSSRLRGATQLGTSSVANLLYTNVKNKNIVTFSYVLAEGERLDHIAGKYLGNGDLWWVIAACSGIGWMMQVPPGTRLFIPRDLNQVLAYVG